MKIGILTFHDGINHGAFLQVFSLCKTLEELGHEVKIINYKNPLHWRNEYKVFLKRKNPFRILENVRKIQKFHRLQRHHLPLTRFTSSPDAVAEEDFDAIVVGSDEVWNFQNPLFGFDPIYFGTGLKAGRIISYAASCGAISAAATLPDAASEGLMKFHSISVRDENSVQLIRENTARMATLVADPTLLVDLRPYSRECPLSDFILIYASGISPALVKEIQLYAKEAGRPTVSIGYNNPWCDCNKVILDPFEWMGYFRNAHSVITPMFHGTLFAIKNKKPFLTLSSPYRIHKYTSFLAAMGLSDRLISEHDAISSMMNAPIDYQITTCKLGEHVLKSRAFLTHAFSNFSPSL